MSVQTVISLIRVRPIKSPPADRSGYIKLMSAVEQYRNEAVIGRRIIVQIGVNESTLPLDTQPYTRLFFPHDALIISFSTNHQHESGVAYLSVHPEWPSFWGMWVVFVEDAIDTFVDQPIGPGEDTVLMFGRIVAVADENGLVCGGAITHHVPPVKATVPS